MVKQYLKGFIIMALSTFIATLHGQTLSIVRQGQFAVGGTKVQHPGAYDNSQFISWSEQVEAGQSYSADHAFVSFNNPKMRSLIRWSMCMVMVIRACVGRPLPMVVPASPR